jgi:hypothetical protein
MSSDTGRVEDKHSFVIESADAEVVAFAVTVVPEVLVDLMVVVAVEEPNGQPALPAIDHFALSVNADVGALPDAGVLWKKSQFHGKKIFKAKIQLTQLMKLPSQKIIVTGISPNVRGLKA